ncbi:MAG TPA: type III pantothenate kinase [Gammaproteobacteria bacterium]|jgi:type III pantothenate kinase|nr:type III pantothenate kinase [Gammaproteobacteria bacterium]
MQALVDIGNTRIKWALYDGGGLLAQGGAVHRGGVDAALGQLAAALPGNLTRVVVANVAGDGFAQQLRAAVGARAPVQFVAPSAERFGVRCAYAEPRRLGVDRWVALLAAHRRARGAACVIDAGTAATFDAVAADGAHLGGLILPGARLLAAALHHNTSDIGATPPPPSAPQGLGLLGRDTASAVGHGAMLALAAALDRAVRTVAAALGVVPKVYLTGGDAAQLRDWLETQVETRADLVLEGLALFAAEPVSPQVEDR